MSKKLLEISHAMKNVCFISNLKKTTFERKTLIRPENNEHIFSHFLILLLFYSNSIVPLYSLTSKK